MNAQAWERARLPTTSLYDGVHTCTPSPTRPWRFSHKASGPLLTTQLVYSTA